MSIMLRHRPLLLLTLPLTLALTQACKGGHEDTHHDDDTSLDDSAEPDDSEEEDIDGDGDGFTPADGDCDDSDATSYPGAAELCDNADNNCDVAVDEGLAACFYPTTGAPYSLEEELAAGVVSAPAEISLSTPGRLTMGSGEWFVSLRISADVSILGAGVDATRLSGGDLLTVIVVEDNPTDAYAVTLSDLTLTNGNGSELHQDDARFPAGGGVFCESTSSEGTTLTLNNIDIVASTADRGGSVYSSGCAVNLDGGMFSGISGDTKPRTGASVYLVAATLTIKDSTISGFTASQIAGAIYVDRESSLHLIDSVMTGNHADLGAHIYTLGPVVCEGVNRAEAGLREGVAEDGGGGVYLADESTATLTSTGCDWGSGGDDNSPDDVASDYFSGETFSTESFTCDAYSGCAAG
jgi:hypothetical protein